VAHANSPRQLSYGQGYNLTPVDRLGVWLSARQVRRHVPTFKGKRLADIGCGYHATFARSVLDEVRSAVLLDVAVEPALEAVGKVRAVEGLLPTALDQVEDSSVDVLLCNSVLEHVSEAPTVLGGFWRVLAPEGVALVNVPSWSDKRFLEASAFRFGLSPAAEVDDHKTYYDPRDLWPLLVSAGFRPRHISCFRHKLGLNTFACCRKPAADR
jgi:2-polyprenyl-3-methyl-5-hydroxy-6-metoxy-1,4-benzoquinol methylase